MKKFKDAFLTAQQQVYTLENQLKEAHERELKLEQTNQDLCQREDQLRRENEVLSLNNQFNVIETIMFWNMTQLMYLILIEHKHSNKICCDCLFQRF